jgi:hypothetical protein
VSWATMSSARMQSLKCIGGCFSPVSARTGSKSMRVWSGCNLGLSPSNWTCYPWFLR